MNKRKILDLVLPRFVENYLFVLIIIAIAIVILINGCVPQNSCGNISSNIKCFKCGISHDIVLHISSIYQIDRYNIEYTCNCGNKDRIVFNKLNIDKEIYENE